MISKTLKYFYKREEDIPKKYRYLYYPLDQNELGEGCDFHLRKLITVKEVGDKPIPPFYHRFRPSQNMDFYEFDFDDFMEFKNNVSS